MIFIDTPREFPPRVEVEPGWIDHVSCDGARWHVLSYGTDAIRCSEPSCIINKERIVRRENS